MILKVYLFLLTLVLAILSHAFCVEESTINKMMNDFLEDDNFLNNEKSKDIEEKILIKDDYLKLINQKDLVKIRIYNKQYKNEFSVYDFYSKVIQEESEKLVFYYKVKKNAYYSSLISVIIKKIVIDSKEYKCDYKFGYNEIKDKVFIHTNSGFYKYPLKRNMRNLVGKKIDYIELELKIIK